MITIVKISSYLVVTRTDCRPRSCVRAGFNVQNGSCVVRALLAIARNDLKQERMYDEQGCASRLRSRRVPVYAETMAGTHMTVHLSRPKVIPIHFAAQCSCTSMCFAQVSRRLKWSKSVYRTWIEEGGRRDLLDLPKQGVNTRPRAVVLYICNESPERIQ